AVDKASDTAKATKASKALNTQKTASTSTGSIKYQRQKAVKEAWKDERNLVEAGQGTRKWSAAEIEELLLTGKVKGYEGHHINSVKDFPHLAGNPDNVTFMTRKEHLLEHFGNWRNKTEGPLLNRKIK
ncbi:MAG: RHS repeat-associated core domain-containing protein, partial [Duncaniella dubosii]|nr:RHS repeat-associated core domain-containing protein [Duncaniella dubosii]